MTPAFLASAGIPTCIFFLGGCLFFTQGGWGSLAAAFVFSFFLAVGGLWFYLGSHLVVSARTRTESWHPVRETSGCSRAHVGDAVTACIPLLWSISLLAHAAEAAAGSEDGAAGSLVTVSIHGYQWGWTYIIPNDVLAAWRASSVLAGHGATVSAAGWAGPARVSSTCGAETWDMGTARDVVREPRGLLSIDAFGGLGSAAAGTPTAVPLAFGRRSAWAPDRASAAGLSNAVSAAAPFPVVECAAIPGDVRRGSAELFGGWTGAKRAAPELAATLGRLELVERLSPPTLLAAARPWRGGPGLDSDPLGAAAGSRQAYLAHQLRSLRSSAHLSWAPGHRRVPAWVAGYPGESPRAVYPPSTRARTAASVGPAVPGLDSDPLGAAAGSHQAHLAHQLRSLRSSAHLSWAPGHRRVPAGVAGYPGESPRAVYPPSTRARTAASVGPAVAGPAAASAVAVSGEPSWPRVGALAGAVLVGIRYRRLGAVMATLFAGHHMHRSSVVHCCGLPGGDWGGGPTGGPTRAPAKMPPMVPVLFDWGGNLTRPLAKAPNLFAAASQIELQPRLPYAVLVNRAARASGDHTVPELIVSPTHPLVIVRWRAAFLARGQILSPFVRLLPLSMRFRCGWMHIRPGGLAEFRRAFLDWDARSQLGAGVQGKPVAASLPSSLGGSGSGGGTEVPVVQGKPVAASLPSSLGGSGSGGGAKVPVVQGKQGKSRMAGLLLGYSDERGTGVSEVLGSSSGTKVLDSTQGTQVKSKVVGSSQSIEVSDTKKVKKTLSMPSSVPSVPAWPTMCAKLLASPADCTFLGKSVLTCCNRLGYSLSGQDPAGWLNGVASLPPERVVGLARSLSRTPGVDSQVVRALLHHGFAPNTPSFLVRLDTILEKCGNQGEFDALLDDVGYTDKPLLTAIEKAIEQSSMVIEQTKVEQTKGGLPSGSARAAMLKLSVRRCLHDQCLQSFLPFGDLGVCACSPRGLVFFAPGSWYALVGALRRIPRPAAQAEVCRYYARSFIRRAPPGARVPEPAGLLGARPTVGQLAQSAGSHRIAAFVVGALL